MSSPIRTRTQLVSGFAFFLVLLGTMSGVAYYALQRDQQSADDMIASHELLIEMQNYGQCTQTVLLQTALGLFLQDFNGEHERQVLDAEIKAIEEKVGGRFSGSDAALFNDIKNVYQQVVQNNVRLYEIARQRIEKKIEFDILGEQIIQAMTQSINTFKDSVEAEELDNAPMIHIAQTMHTALGKTRFIRRAYLELRRELDTQNQKELVSKLVGEMNEFVSFLTELRQTMEGSENVRHIENAIAAAQDCGTILMSLRELMQEQSQIMTRLNQDNVVIAGLLNTLTNNIRRHVGTVRQQSAGFRTLVYQIEIVLAVTTIIVGLVLAYASVKHYAGTLEDVVNKRTAEVFQLQTAVLEIVADMVEFRDRLTGGHNQRTRRHLKILVEELLRSDIYKEEIANWNIDFFLASAQLHDVGKIAIPDGILNKPGKLSDEEYKTMQEHVVVGVGALEKIMSKTNKHAFLHHALAIVGAHHEKWDGSGYPMKLRGTSIPLEGRLMAIADVYDALISERPYKRAFSHEEACQIIERDSGTHFDPVLVDAFRRTKDRFVTAS